MLLRIFYAAGHYRIHLASCLHDCCALQAVDRAADEVVLTDIVGGKKIVHAEQFASQRAVFLHVWTFHAPERAHDDLWLFTKFMPCTEGLPYTVAAA